MYIIRLTPNHSIEHHPQGGSRKKVKSRLVQGMPTSFCKGAEQYCSVVVGTSCTSLKSLNADKSGILIFGWGTENLLGPSCMFCILMRYWSIVLHLVVSLLLIFLIQKSVGNRKGITYHFSSGEKARVHFWYCCCCY